MSDEKLIAVGKSGIHVLDSSGRSEFAASNESFLCRPNCCVLSQHQLCLSLSEKAKLVFVSKDQVFRASAPELVGECAPQITAVEFSTDGELLFCGSKTGKLFVWQTRTGAMLYADHVFYNEVTDLKADDKNSSLLLASSSGDLCLVRLLELFANAARPASYLGHTSHILSLGVSHLFAARGLPAAPFKFRPLRLVRQDDDDRFAVPV